MKKTVVPALFAIAALVAMGFATRPVEATGALEISIRARAVAPGEPLRVDVRSPEPLEALRGTLGTRPVHFVALDERKDRWAAWGVVALDDPPGAIALEVSARTARGATRIGTQAVTVRSAEFPEERLSVEERFVEPPPSVKQRLERERARVAAIYASRRDVPPSPRPFVRPVSGEPTSIFGTRRLYNGKPRSPHPGLDLRAKTGTPVVASGDGTVVLAADLYYSGQTVIVDHGGGLFTLYAHLSRVLVEEGQSVEAGARIALSGATGRVTGPHLHWGAKLGDVPFDPRALLDPALFE